MMKSVLLVITLALGACGGGNDDNRADDAGPSGDGGLTEDGGQIVPTETLPANEVTSGSMKIESATFKMDVQVGHPVSQEPMKASGATLEGGAAVNP